MPIDKGSLIFANYTAKIKDTAELIETTWAEEAKKLNVFDPSRLYEPALISVGEGWVLRGLDEALISANVGDRLTVEVPPGKGFGVRDPSKVRLISLRKFGDKASEIAVGNEVEVDNQFGTVRYVGSGRAQVDFNHRYAGKTIVYDVEILRKLEEDADKVKALIRRRLPLSEERLNFGIDGGTTTIHLPSESYLLEGLQIIKRAISNDIFRYMKSVTSVSFVELFEAPKLPQPIAPPKEEAPAQAPEAQAQQAETVEQTQQAETVEQTQQAETVEQAQQA